jgi:uncharacterized protein YbjT (DUF2867 family)
MNNKKALLLGATGLTGAALLQLLFKSEQYQKVTVLGRSTCGIQHPKLEEILGDLLVLDHFENYFEVDEVFVCIGTTKAKTPNQELYYKIDYGIPVTAARLASNAGVQHFQVISAMGADAKSNIFYNRTKGQMEAEVLRAGIPVTYLIRPALITGPRKEVRMGEGIAIRLFNLINPLLPKKFQSIEAATIAQAMFNLANGKSAKNNVVPSAALQNLGS